MFICLLAIRFWFIWRITVSVLQHQDCTPALESVNEMTISSAEASIQVDDEVDGVYCIVPPFCSPCLYMQLFFFSLANVIVSPEPPHVTTCRKRPPLQHINIIPVMHWNLS